MFIPLKLCTVLLNKLVPILLVEIRKKTFYKYASGVEEIFFDKIKKRLSIGLQLDVINL